MTGILSAWLAEIVLITYRDFKDGTDTVSGLPLPSEYLATFAVYGVLGLAGQTKAEPLAAAVAWGYVGITAFNIVNHATPTKKVATKKPAPTTAT